MTMIIITIIVCITIFLTAALVSAGIGHNKQREENIVVILENIIERLEQLEKR